MAELILNEQQAQIVEGSWGKILVRDAKGKLLGRLEPELSPEMMAELKRRAASPGPWYTGEQIQARLHALQKEWDRTGGFDEAYMEQFLAKLNAADPGHFREKGS